MTQLSVPWGRDNLSIELPSNWTLLQVAQPALRSAGKDWPERVAMVLGQPSSGLSLPKLLAARRGGRIVLVLEDATRHSPLPQILDLVLREFRFARIPLDQVEVLFATGMHPPMSAEQAAVKLGQVGAALKWRSNPWQDRRRYVRVGQFAGVDVRVERALVEADLRVVISSVSPHLQAGFGGGYKMFVPGCSFLETIRCLHRLGIDRAARQLVGLNEDRNPMRSVIDRAGAALDAMGGKTFALQYLLDGDDLPAYVAAGEVLPTYRMVAKQCAVASGIVPTGPADVLITNAHPRDYDLWQCFKSIPNTRWAARPNGVIICLARCEAGLHGMNVPRRWPLGPTTMRRLVRLLGPEALAGLVTRLVPRLAGDAAFFVRMALQALHRNRILMVSPRLVEEIGRFPGLPLFADVQQAVEHADRLLGGPEKPQRVVAYPAGGATFPIPPAEPVR